MIISPIPESLKKDFNKSVTHPLQSYEWGEFREKTGVTVIRGAVIDTKKNISHSFQLTIHKIPHTPFTIGYLPKGTLPTPEIIDELRKIGKKHNSIFIQLEPNILSSPQTKQHLESLSLIPSAHPLFTKYTFILDIQKTEEELFKNLHSKTRYNIRVAQKHKVIVKEDNSEKAFAHYLKLTKETTNRQKFFAHTPLYHKRMWETLHTNKQINKDELSAHLLIASYNTKPLVAWIVFIFHDTLYYPYGASSSENREVMASNLMMWEAIQFAKKHDLKYFDMWGALGPQADIKDPWYGFHKFKMGYNPNLTEFVGSYDLVLQPILYNGYKLADFVRWKMLRFMK